MVQRHSIPHFKPLIVDSKSPEGQGRGNIRSLPRPLLLKSTFFIKSGRGRPIIMPPPNLQALRCVQSGLSNEVLLVFLLFLVLSKIDENQNQHFRCVIAIERICICFKSIMVSLKVMHLLQSIKIHSLLKQLHSISSHT